MIVARAPVRIRLVGGEDDLLRPASHPGGRAVDVAINRYVYVWLSSNGRRSVQITSSDFAEFFHFDAGVSPALADGAATFVQAVLDDFGVAAGVDVFIASETPPGDALGVWGAQMVALVKAVSTYRGQRLTAAQAAAHAGRLLRERLGVVGGVLDAHAAAHGGVHRWEQDQGGSVTSYPLSLDAAGVAALEQRVQLYLALPAAGRSHLRGGPAPSDAWGQPVARTGAHPVRAAVHGLAEEAAATLLRGDLEGLGVLIRRSWEHRAEAGNSGAHPAESWVDRALTAGAIGARIGGRRYGSTLLAVAVAGAEEQLRNTLVAGGLHPLDYRIEWSGARVLMNTEPRGRAGYTRLDRP